MPYIDHREVASILAKRYNPANSISKHLYKNPEQSVRFHFGFIEDHADPDKKGRVKVRFPQWGDGFVSDWAPVIRPFSGSEMGMFFIPEVDEPVVCVFINDNAQKPVVIGSLRRSEDTLPVSDVKDNNLKTMVSRSGSTILIDDKQGEEKIEISMNDGEMKLLLDTKNGMEILNKNGDITISCKAFTVSADKETKITSKNDLVFTSESGKIGIEAKSGECKISAAADVVVDGNEVKLKGKSKVMVMAGNLPVAAENDMVVGVDIHQVKIPAGTSLIDVPLPHPYAGKLNDKLSQDVYVNDKPIATKGSKSEFSSPGHIAMGVQWGSAGAPSNKGEVSSGTCATVKVNDKEIATATTMVKTCGFPQDQETCAIITMP